MIAAAIPFDAVTARLADGPAALEMPDEDACAIAYLLCQAGARPVQVDICRRAYWQAGLEWALAIARAWTPQADLTQ